MKENIVYVIEKIFVKIELTTGHIDINIYLRIHLKMVHSIFLMLTKGLLQKITIKQTH